MIRYPDGLPTGLQSGRSYQLISPLQRSELESGRARQRRRFTSVPEAAGISWLFTDSEAQLFKVWFRDQLVDGSQWFECPLDTPEGFDYYTCRFVDVYNGPSRAGPDLWTISADLELRVRSALEGEWGLLPSFILHKEIFDYAMNREWPLATTEPSLLAEDGLELLTENGEPLTLENS